MHASSLVEREEPLEAMRAAFESARDAGGRVVLVHGDAGVGKTALVRAAVAHVEGGAVIGHCDALSTPRPLGPLRDMAPHVDAPVRTALAEGRAPHEVFAEVLRFVRSAPRLLVFEDVHWADEGTLDLIRYLGRRMPTTSSVLVITYRDIEVGASPGLQQTIGDLVRAGVTTRLALGPLSPRGVAAVIGDLRIDAADVHAKTGGNPFFVVEVLAQPDRPVPHNVRDAVLGRAAELGHEARDALHLLSCAPTGLHAHDLETMGVPGVVLDSLVGRGLLEREHERIRFRHELGRLTFVESLGDSQRRDLHAKLFATLERHDDHALLVDLARGAGQDAAVVAHARLAAVEAARAGAHHQAANFLEIALESSRDTDRASLLEALAYERYHVDDMHAAVHAMEQAHTLREAAGSRVDAARDLRWLSRFEWFRGDRAAAERHADEAVRVAEAAGDERELGFAHGQQATIAMTSARPGPAIAFGSRALAVAERFDDDELRASMLTTVGMALLMTGDEAGLVRIRDSARVAARAGLPEHRARALNNLSFFLVEERRFAEASAALDEGMRFTADRDMDTFHLYSLGTRARMRVLQGQWTAAWDDATAVLQASSAPLNVIWPLWVRGVLGVRRGDRSPERHLEDAWRIAAGFGEAYRLVPIATALAEHEWLTGEDVGAGPRLTELADRLVGSVGRWQSGEVAAWLRCLGRPVPAGLDASGTPYEGALVADTEAVAAAWRAVGAPYEEALTLAWSDDTTHLTLALERCLDLGATTTAGKLRVELRVRGVPVPVRGPRANTRANPAGLTSRQVDVLRLLAEHCTNAEIAARLYISEKTAGHHVSAILTKLQVTSRRDAARCAGDLGLLPGRPWLPDGPDVD